MVAIALSVAVLDEIGGLVSSAHSSVANVFQELGSVEDLVDEFRIVDGEFPQRKAFGLYNDFHLKQRMRRPLNDRP